MEIKDVEGWELSKANNTDPYGARILSYAEDWANFMEREMKLGKKLEDVAKLTSREADTDGITGFMYGAAVATLAYAWKWGDELRRWHNLDIQIGDEGKKANESGGVLNPAILNIRR
jgi:hypothetical protein